MIDLTAKLDGVKRTKACTISSDKERSDSKVVHLTVDFTGATIEDVVNKVMSSLVISFQNNSRSKFEKIIDKSSIEVHFKVPSKIQVDPEEAMLVRLAAMTPEARAAKIAELTAKFKQ
jgi:hypothetical protein